MKRTFALLTLSIVSAGFGWIAHKTIMGENTPGYHWKRIDRYYKFIADPKNRNSSGGFQHTSPPYDIRAHAEALVEFGQVSRREILLPSVPNTDEIVRKWMEIGGFPDVIHAESPHRTDNAEYPLNFTIWYSPTFQDEITQLILSYTQ